MDVCDSLGPLSSLRVCVHMYVMPISRLGRLDSVFCQCVGLWRKDQPEGLNMTGCLAGLTPGDTGTVQCCSSLLSADLLCRCPCLSISVSVLYGHPSVVCLFTHWPAGCDLVTSLPDLSLFFFCRPPE